MKFFSVLSVFLLSISLLPGQVIPLEGKLVLDGKLDDPAWSKAVLQTGFSLLKSRNKSNKQPVQTEFRVLSDRDHLYIGIRCLEPNMQDLVVKAGAGSENVWYEDSVELFLAPCGRKEKFYQFVITAGNIHWQQYYEEAGNITPETFGGCFDSAVYHGKDFWSVEIRLPWIAFYHTPSSEWQQKWLFNVVRTRKKANEYSSWSPLQSGYREPGNFRSMSGFPKKEAANGFAVKTLSGTLHDKQGGEYSGVLQIQIDSEIAKKDLALTIQGKDMTRILKHPVSLKRGKNSIQLPAVFTKSGKHVFRISMTDQNGKQVAERSVSANIKYDPIQFVFQQPFYSQCFYPGQDHSRISGELHISAKVSEVTLSAGGKNYKLPVRNGKAVFDIPNPVKTGSLLLTAFIEANGKKSAEKTAEIKILQPIKQKMVWIEKPGRLVINGKREFGLGWYGGGGKGGFLISDAFAEKYPSPAAKHPYNVDSSLLMAPPNLLRGTGLTEYEQDVYPSQKMIDIIHKRIEENRNRDFIYYYLADEPEYHGVSSIYLEYVYQIIKKADPYHPVMIITTTPNKFMNCADILNPHPYIQPMITDNGQRKLGRPVRSIVDSAKLFLRANRKDKLLFGTPQVFNYRHVNQYAVYPTFDETNAWIWGLICNGGQGLTPFIYYDHASRPDLDFGMDYIYFSIDRLSSYLTAPVEPESSTVNNPDVEQRLIKTKDGILLIVANVSPEAQKATVSAETLKKYQKLFLFREAGVQEVRNGTVSLNLAPYQVRIFTSLKLDEGLISMAEFRQKVAEAEKARRSGPSILFERGHRIEVITSPRIDTDTCVIEDKLFDGVRNIYAFRPRIYTQPIWIECGFKKFTAKFSKMRLYGNQLDAPEFSILKYGKWITLKPVSVKKEKYCLEMDFGKTCTTVKCRIKWQNGKSRFELYEFELIP